MNAAAIGYFEDALPRMPEATVFPLSDEPMVEAWDGYVAEADARGVWPVLRDKLVQLRFPIAPDVSRSDAWGAAVRRGEIPADSPDAMRPAHPEAWDLFIHPSPAGRLPVLVIRHRPDFVQAVQALAHRCEPKAIPPTQGAALVEGLVNWDRIRSIRTRHLESREGGPATWEEHFRTKVIPQKSLYQDRVVLLSDGPYSGVAGDELGLQDEVWRLTSLSIRLGHESAHYLTKRVLGRMRTHAVDEMLADYAGICEATGSFNPSWFLRFLGLDESGAFLPGGRLQNYARELPPEGAEFQTLCATVRETAEALTALDHSPETRVFNVLALASFSLAELRAPGLRDRLRRRSEEYQTGPRHDS